MSWAHDNLLITLSRCEVLAKAERDAARDPETAARYQAVLDTLAAATVALREEHGHAG